MPRKLSPKEAADRIRKWAQVGIDVAVIDALKGALEVDRRESIARAPRKSGELASTVRVVNPSSRSKASKAGVITGGLAAGTKGKGGRAPYGRIIQEGGKTRPHTITPKKAPVLAFQAAPGLVFAKVVQHPGSRYRKQEFLKINVSRVAKAIDDFLQKRANKEIG